MRIGDTVKQCVTRDTVTKYFQTSNLIEKNDFKFQAYCAGSNQLVTNSWITVGIIASASAIA